MDESMELFFDLPEASVPTGGAADPVLEDCRRIAADILGRERYLTWTEREFLECVVQGSPFEESRMRAIASNWGVVL